MSMITERPGLAAFSDFSSSLTRGLGLLDESETELKQSIDHVADSSADRTQRTVADHEMRLRILGNETESQRGVVENAMQTSANAQKMVVTPRKLNKLDMEILRTSFDANMVDAIQAAEETPRSFKEGLSLDPSASIEDQVRYLLDRIDRLATYDSVKRIYDSLFTELTATNYDLAQCKVENENLKKTVRDLCESQNAQNQYMLDMLRSVGSKTKMELLQEYLKDLVKQRCHLLGDDDCGTNTLVPSIDRLRQFEYDDSEEGNHPNSGKLRKSRPSSGGSSLKKAKSEVHQGISEVEEGEEVMRKSSVTQVSAPVPVAVEEVAPPSDADAERENIETEGEAEQQVVTSAPQLVRKTIVNKIRKPTKIIHEPVVIEAEEEDDVEQERTILTTTSQRLDDLDNINLTSSTASSVQNNNSNTTATSALGLIYTGYLDKKNSVTGSFKRRFVVLTQNALHWFKREDSDDLFGAERGQMSLSHILSNRILGKDSTIFEIQGNDGKTRHFRAATNVCCEEWVSAIRSAVKPGAQRARPGSSRRTSLNAVNYGDHDDDDEHGEGDETAQVHVIMVTQLSALQQNEIVMAREPEWGKLICLPTVRKGDQIIISLSNGGTVPLSYEVMVSKAEDAMEFEVAVRDVPLASSLRISFLLAGASSSGAGWCSIGPTGKFAAFREKISDFAQVAISDRSFTVLFIMAIMGAISSFIIVGQEAFLLYLFAGALSAYNVYQVFDKTRLDHPQSMKKGLTLRLVIHGHTFTSPDNPVVEVDNEIPQRFVDGCDGDLIEARRRWDITRHWRESEGVNNILSEPQPYFHLIKSMYPHYICGKGKSGNVVYYERPCDIEVSQLTALGVTVEVMVRHWLFCNEYQWGVVCGGDETAKSIAVLDIERFTIGDLAGMNLEYLKKIVGYAYQHYPERSQVILIVNASYFLSFLWKVIRPLVHENAQRKVRILSSKEVLSGLMEYIDIEQIPQYYGGKLYFGGSCRFQCPETLAVNEYVRKLNEQNGTNVSSTVDDTSPSIGGNVSGSPGNRGAIPDHVDDGASYSNVQNVANVWIQENGRR